MLVKLLLLVCLQAITTIIFAQEKKIVSLLNKQLQKEILLRDKNFEANNFWIIQPFQINENKYLSLEIKTNIDNGYQIERQEVSLNKIKAIVKDINIIFEIPQSDVLVTKTIIYDDGQKEIISQRNSLFFTYLYIEQNNEKLGKKLVKAFRNIGIDIKKEYWYD